MSCNIEQHKMHMCALKSEGTESCIKDLSSNPTVECENCGARANSAQNVCAPKLLSR